MISKLMRTTWYPRPHRSESQFGFGLETGVANWHTIIPAIMHDEGLGSPSAYESHPENASFVDAEEPNCFPESRIESIFWEITFNLTKAFLETDKGHALKFGFMPIHTAFMEGLDALDELSTQSVKTIIEMQHESTDRQAYPLWNGVDMSSTTATGRDLAANVPGLTTDQKIEGTAFDIDLYYDALQYYTNAGKLKKLQSGIKWVTLTRQHPVHKILIKQRSGTKRMNQYTFLGCAIMLPQVETNWQIPFAAETTNVTHLGLNSKYRYLEWHQDFNHKRL